MHSQSLPVDILSNLPDNIIDVLLMYLPCKDAVRTSILSKKWRYNWCRRTEFAFDDSHSKSSGDLPFTTIINQLLTRPEVSITKFTLDIRYLKYYPKIDNFIYFLSRSIQQLSLHFPRDESYKLPSSLFTCSQLRHLTLHDCLIHHPSAVKGFDRLIRMELIRVSISPKLLEDLISHCPLLEQLVLDSEIRNVIEINAPMLKSFDFTGYMNSIRLKNVPLLAKVSLINSTQGVFLINGYQTVKNSDIAKFFKFCSALEHLFIKCCVEMEGVVEAPTRLSFNLNSVKRLYLHDIWLIESHQLSCVLWLLRCFPCLEYLEIKVLRCFHEANGYVQEPVELERFADVTFNRLREVNLVYFSGFVHEMQLIEFLRAKSPVLKRLSGGYRYYDEDSEGR